MAGTFAKSLQTTLYTEGFNGFVTTTAVPIATGWSDVAGWDLHPLKIAAFPRRTQQSGRMGLENITERDSIARLP